ncbi:hypothetical protein PaG_01288 [Moesziomyces aphidis]|uniref:Uncharacterized protein n=1 Tax=Moesziomyces aphidis TaxID=84754 RepID=W3VS19_MOEAP|nr:hypothetical protein PaG_01288 [Moesziomyces aphidis]
MSHSDKQQLNQEQHRQRSSNRNTQASLGSPTGEQNSQPQPVEETPAVPSARPLPPPSPQQQQPAIPVGPKPVRAETQPRLAASSAPKMQSRTRKQARLKTKQTSNEQQVNQQGLPPLASAISTAPQVTPTVLPNGLAEARFLPLDHAPTATSEHMFKKRVDGDSSPSPTSICIDETSERMPCDSFNAMQ